MYTIKGNLATCDSTGTLYQGRTCEQVLVIVSEFY